MPHHSKQGQQQRQHANSTVYAPGSPGHLHSQQSFPPTDARLGVDYHSRMSIPSSMSMPPGNAQFMRAQNTTHWTARADSADDNTESVELNTHHSPYHRVPASPPDAAGVNSRTADHMLKNEEKDPSKSYEKRSPSQEISSVLLLAAAASSSKDLAMSAEQKDEESLNSEPPIESSRPLKKRKNLDDILRKKPDVGSSEKGEANHISPISTINISTGVMATKEGPPCDNTSVSFRSLSYESKNDGSAKANVESAKQGDGVTNAQLPAHVMIPNFPAALHWLLTESSSQSVSPDVGVDYTVLQWVSHGQAWRIVRWDAFHRKVLPKFFPQISMELEGRQFATGSIDAFLWHLKAWGFEEIKDGPDVGAFAHTLFRRGHPQLCREMRFLSDNEFETPSSTSVDSRSILRVPSLASTAGSHETRPSARSEHEDCALALFEAKHQARSNNSNVRDFTGTPMRRQSILVANGSSPWATPPVRMHSGHGPPVFVNYRPEEMNLKAESWPFHPTNQAPVQWMGGGHPTTPPQRLGVRTQGMPPYSPIRIRSGRGARRLSMGNNNAPHVTSGPSTDPSPSKSFPVSNRGMGRRNVAAALSRQANAGNDELTMLSKTEDKDLLPSDILTDTQANAPATLNTQSSFDVQHFRAV